MTLSRLFSGKKVRLTAFKREDLPIITGWYRHSDFIRMYEGGVAGPRTDDQWQKWYQNLDSTQDSYSFAIRPIDDERIIGMIDINGILWNQGSAWMAIAIGEPSNQGKGYGSEAIRLMLAFAFQELNLHRVQLTVFEYNQRAIEVYEKLGFVREGVFRQAIHRDGQRLDMLLYGILRPEWEQNSES